MIAFSGMKKTSKMVLNLAQKSIQHLSKHGLTGLLQRILDYLIRRVLIVHYSISALDLPSNSSKECTYMTEPEQDIEIPAPQNPKLDKAFQKYPSQIKPNRGFVRRIRHCRFVGSNAVALQNGKTLILETCRYQNVSGEELGSPYKIAQSILQSYFSISSKGSNGLWFPLICNDPSYYHWMMEYLPKLRFYEHFQKKTGLEPTIIIEHDPPDYVCETLSCAGYDQKRLKQWSGRRNKITDLVTSVHHPHIFNYDDPGSSNYQLSLQSLMWLRRRMRTHTHKKDNVIKRGNRLYISRQDTDRERKVENIDEIRAVLEKYEFKICRLENLSFSEQLDLFANANVVMGPHGAGLVNMIFSRDPTVIELFPKSVIKPHFYNIAKILSFDYQAHISSNTGNNLIVDPNRLQKLLKRVLD